MHVTLLRVIAHRVGLIVVVLAGTAHAEHRITTAAPPSEVAGPRKPIDLHIAKGTVARETARAAAPALHHDFSLASPAADKKKWHPRWYVKPMSRMSATPTPHPLVPCDRPGADAGTASVTGLTFKLRF
jgi:hypothetical protein